MDLVTLNLILQMVLHLDRGDKVDQRTILRRLAELAILKEMRVDFKRAVYSVQEEIVIDVYPADSDKECNQN